MNEWMNEWIMSGWMNASHNSVYSALKRRIGLAVSKKDLWNLFVLALTLRSRSDESLLDVDKLLPTRSNLSAGNRCTVGVTIPASFLSERFGSKRYVLAPKPSLYSTTTPSTSLYVAMMFRNTSSFHYVIN